MSKSVKITCGILAALTLVGFGAWVFQQVYGLGVTGMSNGTSWGLYICMFMFFVGLSAGGLIVASSASVFHIAEYKKVALPAIILSTACITVAGMFVLADLGSIVRIWRLFTGPNLTSPLVWDITVITIYLVINVVYLVNMVSSKPGAAHRVEITSRFALPVAILVHTVTAWIFGLQIGREWYSSIMGPLFVASAMDSGLALLLLVLMGLRRKGWFDTSDKLISSLSGLMITCVAVDAYMVGCEIVTAAYPMDASALQALNEMFVGATAPFFWCEVLCGIVIPLALLLFAKNRRNMKLVAFSSVLIVIGVFCKRVWLLFTSFIHPNIAYGPGVSSGSYTARQSTGDQIWATVSNYTPQLPELLIVVGIIAFGALAFIVIAFKLLPLYRKAQGEDAEGRAAKIPYAPAANMSGARGNRASVTAKTHEGAVSVAMESCDAAFVANVAQADAAPAAIKSQGTASATARA